MTDLDVTKLLERLDEARNQSKTFGLTDEQREGDELDRARALHEAADAYRFASGYALALDALPELAADAHDAIRTLSGRVAELEAALAVHRVRP